MSDCPYQKCLDALDRWDKSCQETHRVLSEGIQGCLAEIEKITGKKPCQPN
jgi:hypothetical protein